MDDLLYFITFLGFIFLCIKFYQRTHGKSVGFDVIRFDQEMEDLQKQRVRATTMHQMLTDIEICGDCDEEYKIFNLSWINEATGESLSYDIYVYDKKSPNAQILKSLANVELEDMKPDLQKRVDKLRLRSVRGRG